MKKFIIILLLFSFVTGCEPFVAFDYLFNDEYEYDAVYCFAPEKHKAWKQDTTICFSFEDLTLIRLHSWSDGKKSGQNDLGLGTIDVLFEEWGCDTVSFFLFEKTVVDNNSWEDIVEHYLILQRYDFTINDLIKLKCQIYYPPIEEMSGIHMYPPYEEVTKKYQAKDGPPQD